MSVRLQIISLVACAAASSLDSMVTSAERVLDAIQFERDVDRDQRFLVAVDAAGMEDVQATYGVYGEMPLRAIAEVLLLPSVKALAEKADARFVDFGSGAGRLLLGVAAMRGWASAVGVEAIEGLHSIAVGAIARAEAANAIEEGIVSSVHAGVLPHESPTADALSTCDICFMYSTAFPSEDGLRLPELSASLSCVLREGAIVVTTDKFLVGERFVFEQLLPVEGAEGERIHAFVWRVHGSPSQNYLSAIRMVEEVWMGEDACAQNEEACAALLAVLGEEEEENDDGE